ncbi:hypothetical protein LCL95_05935 [Bacillus timonensis]|nr:hypothetical protein [Bacillus timonensis]
MLIKECKGYELEKAQPNTSEDFFNRSEVTFVDNGEEKTFHLLYIRYFDEAFSQFTPFKEDPVFTVENKHIYFKDIVGIVCLLKNPGFRFRKRVYINTIEDFESYFKDIDYKKLNQMFVELISKGQIVIGSPLDYVVHS